MTPRPGSSLICGEGPTVTGGCPCGVAPVDVMRIATRIGAYMTIKAPTENPTKATKRTLPLTNSPANGTKRTLPQTEVPINGAKRTRVAQTDVPAFTLAEALRVPEVLRDEYAKQPTI